ncbi:hypothetical protein J113_25050 [Mycobacterium tuberculosis CAS/NITR204]|uniref:Metallo-beta-lactamase domain-containing protein n=1 Tax=Mycobacterium tuberculosis CAS/NITR204 TaxID=1310114 RepID=R4MJM6_MYCTX|nr:hypothetical protein J113_25050 [Mycobacterium tuberculosis CAS/NITR204]
MRPKLGRPNIARYSNRFSVPTARSDAPLSVTWMGVATLLVDDGSSALMTDGYFSRPGLARVAAGKVSPSAERVDGCLARANVSRLTAVIPVHTHIDHAMDSALVADRTGAQLVGGESAANVGRGYGLPEESLVVAVPGEPIQLGAFDVTLVESHHCPPDRFPGVISAPLTPPVKASAYRCGEAWSTLVHHRTYRRFNPGQRRFRQRRTGRLPRRCRLPQCRPARPATAVIPARILDRDRAHGGRPPRDSHPLGRLFSRCQSRCGPCHMRPTT